MPLTEQDFLLALGAEFDGVLTAEELVPNALLVDDLGLDSLELLRAIASIESMAAHAAPDDIEIGSGTLHDLYELYVHLASLGRR